MAALETSVITYIHHKQIEEAAKLLNEIQEPQRTETIQSLYASNDLTNTQKQLIFDIILAMGRSPSLNDTMLNPIDEDTQPILTRTGNRTNQ